EMERFLGKSVILDYGVNPDLLGGIVVKSGDLMVDTSIKTSLEIIRQSLVGKKILGEKYYEN
ncbi:MAG: F0F1 ATP synthase subunit delta, partial [Spirochaetia bacterium]|nr:F0F1 ATP synthase subunit delta [Spirochaetia bacterium]